ncbi:MAG: hypothetical protein JOZ80_16310 [Acidobacteriaceae bacterium]|nr:hypothetical protein [Acidobacteriaceae bacterium]
MTHDTPVDFGKLYRAAFAERDPQRKQLLLSQVQKAISNTVQDENITLPKFGPQSIAVRQVSALA